MSPVVQDLRYALRTLAKTPSLTLFALLSLALGIGANAAIFSVVDAFFWRPFPVRDPDRLVAVFTTDRKNNGFLPVSRLNFEDFRGRTDVFSGMAATSIAAVDVTVQNETTRVPAMIATGNYFDVVGVRPVLGAGFRADQDEPLGGNPVVLLSNGYWKRRFGGDPSLVGRPITVNRKAYTVVGVLPENFTGMLPGFAPDVWVPYGMRLHIQPVFSFLTEGRRGLWLAPVARLKPGITREQAQSSLATFAAALEKEFPDANLGRSVVLRTLAETRANPTGAAQNTLPRIAALFVVAVGVILLIASANVANLLLARASSRRKEIAVRIAIGATRGRLIRQLLAESALLAAAGAACGLLLSAWFTNLLMSLQPPGPFPFALGARTDWRVLLFTSAVAALTGLAFGLFPALQASNPEVYAKLKESRQGELGARGGVRRILVVGEVALATLALAATGLLLRSLREATAIDPGFRAEKAVGLSLDVSLQDYNQERGAEFYRRLVERTRELPGVRFATLASRRPLAGGILRTIFVEGDVPSERERGVLVNVAAIERDYFETLQIPLVAGRPFGPEDVENSPPVAIINQTMAKRFWPGRDPVGQAFRFPTSTGSDSSFTPPLRIVGIARDSKYVTLGEAPIPFVYLPFRQNYTPAMNLLVRTEGEPSTVLGAIRQEVASMDPGLPFFNVQPLAAQIEGALWLSRVGAYLLAAFGGFALLLTMVGTYGVLAYTVARQTPEIGLRMALGAGPSRIVRMVVGSGMALVAAGLAAGLAVSILLARSLTPILFGIQGSDPATFAGITLILGSVALVACYVPARHAAAVDPTIALRQE